MNRGTGGAAGRLPLDSSAMTAQPAEQESLRDRRFPLWVGLALSVATVGPTLAMAGNGQGLIGTVGKAVPLVFVIGLFGVALVGYSFVRLTRHLNHAGSAYALVGVTVGPRAGFFSGFAMLGAYVAFSIATLALTAAFANSLLAELQKSAPHPFQLPWLLPVVVAGAGSIALTGRDTRLLAKILLGIEGAGIAAMLVLAAVIFARGGAPPTGVDFSVFSPSGIPVSAVLAGVVTAFLSWAGFEACTSMGEESDDPRRSIPRALAGTLGLTGVLFVVVMFAQTIGFGTDAAGLRDFERSSNTLGDLGDTYVGAWFSLLLILTTTVGAFGCHLATAAISGRMLFAFARDGLAPAGLARLDPQTGGPRRAVWLTVALAVGVNVICGTAGWPPANTGDRALDTYFLFAVAGSVCLMVCYLLVEVAAIWFVGAPRFAVLHGGEHRIPGLALPAAGIVVILVVLWFSVKDAGGWSAAPLLGAYWCAAGLVIALAASGKARRVGAALAAEVAAAD
jgi:amino acid transporter